MTTDEVGPPCCWLPSRGYIRSSSNGSERQRSLSGLTVSFEKRNNSIQRLIVESVRLELVVW